MPYSIVFSNLAEKQLIKLDAGVRAKVIVKIESLVVNPYGLSGIKALTGKLKGLSRARVGDFRILYRVEDAVLIVLIVSISDRKDAYK